jgi:hypothetical protein
LTRSYIQGAIQYLAVDYDIEPVLALLDLRVADAANVVLASKFLGSCNQAQAARYFEKLSSAKDAFAVSAFNHSYVYIFEAIRRFDCPQSAMPFLLSLNRFLKSLPGDDLLHFRNLFASQLLADFSLLDHDLAVRQVRAALTQPEIKYKLYDPLTRLGAYCDKADQAALRTAVVVPMLTNTLPISLKWLSLRVGAYNSWPSYEAEYEVAFEDYVVHILRAEPYSKLDTIIELVRTLKPNDAHTKLYLAVVRVAKELTEVWLKQMTKEQCTAAEVAFSKHGTIAKGLLMRLRQKLASDEVLSA